MLEQIIEQFKKEGQKALDNFSAQIAKLRAGTLSVDLFENIKIECFGQEFFLKQLGVISLISARELKIQLWDNSYVEPALKAMQNQGLGIPNRIDGTSIYFLAPPLTSETRKELLGVLNQKKEEVFQEFRRLRDKSWKSIQDGFAQGLIREDDKFKGRDKLDEAVRDFREKMDKIAEQKEKEILG